MAEKTNYTIKVCKDEAEDKNRRLYVSKKAILDKWLSVCSDVNEHGDKQVYEKCLVQAFNLTEFVMDNWIEDMFRTNNQKGNLERIPREREKAWQNGIYRFIEQGVVIDFDEKIGHGYYGKTVILEMLGIVLPKDINTVRKKRNNYAHGTDTYKNATREELDDFPTVLHYMDTLGELLLALKKIPVDMVRPTYETLKLKVGNTLGYDNKYVVLELVEEEKEYRLFAGRDGKTQREVSIKEILPRTDLLDIFRESKEYLLRVVGNGIVRTEDVILKNNACYIVTERVAGQKLYSYVKAHQADNEIKKDLLYQLKKIVTALQNNPNISAEFRESDFVVDAGGDLWLTQYEFGKMQLSPEEVIRRYEMILAIEEEQTEVFEEPEVVTIEEEQSIENSIEIIKAEPVTEEEGSDLERDDKAYVVSAKKNSQGEMVQLDVGSNQNDWSKLCYTIGACGGFLVILWALSMLFS
ncbi:MAG: hypothetical protein PUB52_11530 [Lachnospiraceae bacterium]|nr:hypothetical protein [Lachnospiraceae bacterium]